MEVYILGGGWFGCLHGGQLLRGWQRGKVPLDRLAFVDRADETAARSRYGGLPVVDFIVLDWRQFLVEGLWREVRDVDRAYVVPAPRAPHLMFEFLDGTLRRARPGWRMVRVTPPWSFGLPYERRDGNNNLFISAAGWQCPATCIEPRCCPALRAPRTWHLPDLVEHRCRGLASEVFYSSNFAYGVAGIPVGRLWEARVFWDSDADDKLPRQVVVATLSACHGVVALAEVKRPCP
jgi:hypothetical protein